MSKRFFLYTRKSSESEDRQVLSIDSQIDELRTHADKLNIEIVETFQESKSAKSPGRPIFAQMMARIEKGEVDGIVCWKPDRLARNPVDGGALIWALDQGKIAEIVTPFRTYRRSSDDAFFMQLEFGIAKKYVDDLSENVKRGIRKKIADGEPPGAIPIGYKREPETKKVVPDPERFAVLKQVWKEVVEGVLSPREVLDKANNEWGLRTPMCRRSHGGPLSPSGFYTMLQNPFYTGSFLVKGELHPGKYEPMILPSEFREVQRILNRKGSSRPQHREFAYRGMMRCGRCGRGVTAEAKVNRFGTHYTYYHCSRKKPWREHCKEPSIEEKALEEQIIDFLRALTIPKEVLKVVDQHLSCMDRKETDWHEKESRSKKATLKSVERQITELVRLKIRKQVGEEEYLREQQELVAQQHELKAAIRKPHEIIEPIRNVFSYATLAEKRFIEGNMEEKRRVLHTVGSNLLLEDKKLRITAKKPFRVIAERPRFPNWLRLVDEVRTYLA